MYLSLRASQGDESTREKEFTSWLRVRSLFSTWVRIGDFVPCFYTQNLLGFDSYLEIIPAQARLSLGHDSFG